MTTIHLGKDSITSKHKPELLLVERYGKHHKFSLTCYDGTTDAHLLGETLKLSIETASGTIEHKVSVGQISTEGKLDDRRQKIYGHSPTIHLARTNMRSFANETAESILQTVLGAYNMNFSSDLPALQERLPYIVQLEPDFDFIRRVCSELGVGLYASGQGLHCQALASAAQADFDIEESELEKWSLKIATRAPVPEVVGYDFRKNQTIRRKELSTSGNILVQFATDCAKKGSNIGSRMLCPSQVDNEAALKRQAGYLYRPGRPPVVFSGKSTNPNFSVGKVVRFQPAEPVYKNLNPRDTDFMFRIIKVKHRVRPDGAYSNSFIACSSDFPANPLLPFPRAPRLHFIHGIVLDNLDNENLGRVQVKLPWDKPEQAQWLRTIQPQSGKTLKWHCPPEKQSRVLVAFEDGQVNSSGFVLGSFYDGGTKAPAAWGKEHGFQLGKVKFLYNPETEKLTIKGVEIEIDASGNLSHKGKQIHLN